MNPAAICDAQATFSGRLVRDATARMKPIDREGHMLPVLVLELESDGELRMPLRVEQHFPPDGMDAANAAARRYRKGLHVTVDASVLSARLAVTATHIHTQRLEDTTP